MRRLALEALLALGLIGLGIGMRPPSTDPDIGHVVRAFDPTATPRPKGDVQANIVGGIVSPPNSWPYIAAIVNAGQEPASSGQYCGGAHIQPEWVLTAAHCFITGGVTKPASEVEVVIGRQDLASGSDGDRVGVSQIIIHPEYANSKRSDVALLKLVRASTSPTVAIGFPADSALYNPGVTAIVAGWGNTSSGGSGSSVLRQVEVPLVSSDTCNQPESYNGTITSDLVCAGFPEGGKDSCQGDSGGPLFTLKNGVYVQIAVVNFGEGCAAPNKYGVYLRTASYIDWLYGHMSTQVPGGEIPKVPRAFFSYIFGSFDGVF